MSTMKAISAPFTKGINFTNWLEYRPADQIDPNYFTKQDFINAKSLGCDVIRLPIHFEKLCSAADGYAIPQKILNILDKVIEWTKELELYIILDFHNATDADSHTGEDVEKILNPVWTQIAERYKHATDYIIYELMNEPHGIEVPVWNAIIERVFKLVRSIDKNHYIVAGGADWNSFAAMKTLPDFQDDKVIYTFHFYDPHTFTHQGANWCHMERVVNIPFPYDAARMPALPADATEHEKECFATYPEKGTIAAVEAYFDQYVTFSRERNAPIYCGEFGCFSYFTKPEERVNWYTIVTNLLAERGISRTSWDYYGSFGIFKNVSYEKKPEFPQDLDMGIVKALGLNEC